MCTAAGDDVRGAVLAPVKRQFLVQHFERHRPAGFQVFGGVDRLPALPQQIPGRPAWAGVLEVRFLDTVHLVLRDESPSACDTSSDAMKFATMRSIVAGSKSSSS